MAGKTRNVPLPGEKRGLPVQADPDVSRWYQMGLINRIDQAFAEMIDRRYGGIDPWAGLAAALVSRAAASGDVCLDLGRLATKGYQAPDASRRMVFPFSLEQWLDRLSKCPAIGSGVRNKPIILDGNRLYLQRYWKYERAVGQGILQRCGSFTTMAAVVSGPVAASSDLPDDDDEDQRRAVETALNNRFSVISGGPGTGKTYTVARIILALQNQSGGSSLRVKLAAPTGKAAARLQETLDRTFERLGKNGLNFSGDACRVQTIHRMLGAVPGKVRFRYNAGNRLPADVVVVDEASMVDLALMAKLIDALQPVARLILVGDKDQLASVEAGAVLGDICWGLGAADGPKRAASTFADKSDVKPGLHDHIVILNRSYRFDDKSGIDKLGNAINAGDAERVLSMMQDHRAPDILIRPLKNRQDMDQAMEDLVMERIAPAFEQDDPHKALDQLNTIKILTPLRKGPTGVETLNQRVEQILSRRGVIDPLRPANGPWYSGRPVMITCNDYYHNLYNGDVGLTFGSHEDGRRNRLQVLFPDAGQRLKSFAPEQLPANETVYAMTVHKSQGTEFEKVLLVLPDMDVPLLTRELVYTAVTRARRQVEIWGRADLLKKAIGRRIERASGLRWILWPER